MELKFSTFKKFVTIAIVILWSLIAIGCTPINFREESIRLEPSQISTISPGRVTTSSWSFCVYTRGTGPLEADLGQILVGYDHIYDSDFFCPETINHIYQGAVRFSIYGTKLYNKLIKNATLKYTKVKNSINIRDRGNSCAVNLGTTEVEWWQSQVGGLIPVYDLRRLPSFGTDFSINVTSTVQRWANGREHNNGFILIGSKENFDSFSDEGMLTDEECVS